MIDVLIWYINSNPFGMSAIAVSIVAVIVTFYNILKFKIKEMI